MLAAEVKVVYVTLVLCILTMQVLKFSKISVCDEICLNMNWFILRQGQVGLDNEINSVISNMYKIMAGWVITLRHYPDTLYSI